MARYKNVEWNLFGAESDKIVSKETIHLALLMDIRDQLQLLNGRFASLPCIPGILRSIERLLKNQRRCPWHPRHSGSREPKRDCAFCRRLYKGRRR